MNKYILLVTIIICNSGILKYSTIDMWEWFKLQQCFFHKCGCSCIWSLHIKNWKIILVDFFLCWVWSFSISFGYTSLFPRSICFESTFPTLYSEVMFIFNVKVWFLYAEEDWILFSRSFLTEFKNSVYFYLGSESIDIQSY